jgi:hypothetical protein
MSKNEDRLLYVRTDIYGCWGLITQGVMLPPRLVAHNECPSSLPRLVWRRIILPLDLRILHRPPQPFDAHVVESPAPPVHTHVQPR